MCVQSQLFKYFFLPLTLLSLQYTRVQLIFLTKKLFSIPATAQTFHFLLLLHYNISSLLICVFTSASTNGQISISVQSAIPSLSHSYRGREQLSFFLVTSTAFCSIIILGSDASFSKLNKPTSELYDLTSVYSQANSVSVFCASCWWALYLLAHEFHSNVFPTKICQKSQSWVWKRTFLGFNLASILMLSTCDIAWQQLQAVSHVYKFKFNFPFPK